VTISLRRDKEDEEIIAAKRVAFGICG